MHCPAETAEFFFMVPFLRRGAQLELWLLFAPQGSCLSLASSGAQTSCWCLGLPSFLSSLFLSNFYRMLQQPCCPPLSEVLHLGSACQCCLLAAPSSSQGCSACLCFTVHSAVEKDSHVEDCSPQLCFRVLRIQVGPCLCYS